MSKINKKIKSPSALMKLLRYLTPYRKYIILGVLAGLFATVARLYAPILIKNISDIILESEKTQTAMDFSKIAMYACICIALYVIGALFDCLNVYWMIGITADSSKNLRKDMFNKINRMPLNYFDTREIGLVLSYFTNDVDIIGQTLSISLSSFVSSVVTILGALILLFVMFWQMGIVAIIAIPVALISLVKIGGASQKHFTVRQKYLSEVSSVAEESYSAFTIVKSFRANDDFKKKFASANEKLMKSTSKADFYASIMNPVMTVIGNVMLAFMCVIGGVVAYYLIGNGLKSELQPSLITSIVAGITYGNQLIPPLSQVAQILSTLTQASAAADRVFKLLEEEEQENEDAKTGKIENVKGNVSFENVKFGYVKDKLIIHNFSEVAKQGQKVAIVGPTGAGKTTMVNLLMRFYEINDGAIKIEGIDTKTINRTEVRKQFGMVLQDTWLFEGTFMENLKFSRRDATDEEVIEACKATHCDEFIRQQAGGYNGLITDECGLSSGQKQLLTIARAMVQNAPMLILDEATSSVDTRTELLIQDAMDKLMKGRTSFVIAHRLSTIKNSDLILVMKDGDVIESGNHNELMEKQGFYADLYNAQFTGKGPQLS